MRMCLFVCFWNGFVLKFTDSMKATVVCLIFVCSYSSLALSRSHRTLCCSPPGLTSKTRGHPYYFRVAYVLFIRWCFTLVYYLRYKSVYCSRCVMLFMMVWDSRSYVSFLIGGLSSTPAGGISLEKLLRCQIAFFRLHLYPRGPVFRLRPVTK